MRACHWQPELVPFDCWVLTFASGAREAGCERGEAVGCAALSSRSLARSLAQPTSRSHCAANLSRFVSDSTQGLRPLHSFPFFLCFFFFFVFLPFQSAWKRCARPPAVLQAKMRPKGKPWQCRRREGDFLSDYYQVFVSVKSGEKGLLAGFELSDSWEANACSCICVFSASPLSGHPVTDAYTLNLFL